MEFHQLYRPLTASPFRNSALYRELLPCPALRPWETHTPSICWITRIRTGLSQPSL